MKLRWLTPSPSDGNSLFHMTWPVFIELVLQMLVGNVDQFMISRVSQNSVAAIGNANQIINVSLLTFNVVSAATTILVAQYLGSQNYGRISQIYTLAIVVNLAFSLIVAVVLVGLNRQIFE